jgi:hypothetical protein
MRIASTPGMRKRRAAVALLALGLLVLAALPAAAAGSGAALAVQPGEFVPDLAFDVLLSPEDYAALGLSRGEGPFRLTEVPGELLVLEFFNRYCLTCQRQARYLDSFWEVVRSGDLAGRVRVLGVGVGNRPRDLAAFRREFGAGYPLSPDPTFDRLRELGDPGGTPFTVFLLRRGEGWLLADYHLGLQGDVELMARTRVLLAGRAGVAAAVPEPLRDRQRLRSYLSSDEELARARAFLARVSGRSVEVAVRTLGDGTRVFEARDPDGTPTGLYGRVGSRDPVCDICHAVHFFFAFDARGTARGFEPIHVTKYGNELWSEADVARTVRALEGRRLADLEFDPEVDAVTSATMSSALIFDEVRRAAPLVAELSRP